MNKNKTTHGGAGRGQGAKPEGDKPKIILKRLVSEETFAELERIRIERGLKTIGNVLDADYKPKTNCPGDVLEQKRKENAEEAEMDAHFKKVHNTDPDLEKKTCKTKK